MQNSSGNIMVSHVSFRHVMAKTTNCLSGQEHLNMKKLQLFKTQRVMQKKEIIILHHLCEQVTGESFCLLTS